MVSSPAKLSPGGWALAGLFTGSGVLHLLRPQTFTPLIPRSLRSRDRELVLASGVAELVCAAGLAHPRTRAAAGLASACLLVAVLPANVQMSLSWRRRARRRQDLVSRAMFLGSLVRLPLQWPLIRIGLRAAGRA